MTQSQDTVAYFRKISEQQLAEIEELRRDTNKIGNALFILGLAIGVFVTVLFYEWSHLS
jgi:uncharacterized membrane protein